MHSILVGLSCIVFSSVPRTVSYPEMSTFWISKSQFSWWRTILDCIGNERQKVYLGEREYGDRDRVGEWMREGDRERVREGDREWVREGDLEWERELEWYLLEPLLRLGLLLLRLYLLQLTIILINQREKQSPPFFSVEKSLTLRVKVLF